MNAIYTRQSVDRADSISIESQIEFCQYEMRGEQYKVYTDRGYSGKNTDRPAFAEMMNDIESGVIGKVVVYKLDRISRSILDFSNMMEKFGKHRVEFVSTTEKFDTSSPMGRAMLNICIVFAQLERETIQKRVADAYYSRSQKSFYMGGRVPYGFRLIPTTIEGTVLIYPAGRWIQRSGKGMASFGLEQINDHRLSKVYFYPDSKEVFSSAAIADGISVVVKDMNKTSSGFDYIYCKNGKENGVNIENPGENIIPLNPKDISIVRKLESYIKQESLHPIHDRILPQKLFGIESDFVEKNSKSVYEWQPNTNIDYSHQVKLTSSLKPRTVSSFITRVSISSLMHLPHKLNFRSPRMS